MSYVNTRFVSCTLGVLTSCLILAEGTPASGQSATRQAMPMSAPRAATTVGLEGYCPVCVVEMKKWVKGNANHQVTFDGKTYHFPGADQKQMFLGNPAKYTPAFGGNCTVCFAKMGKTVPGNIRFASLRGGRLFLFPGKDQQAEFRQHAQQYENVDLAMGGNCVVCRVEMGKDVPGKPEISTVHRGIRYQFPGTEQRDMFRANPTKYAVNPREIGQQSSSSRRDSQTKLIVSIRGESGCAGCDHGVAPVGAPDELGLAINTPNGTVFVVEDAHVKYPEIYSKRFDQLTLKVSGKIIQRQGKFAWIQPSLLESVN